MAYVANLTIDHTKVAADLTDYVVAIIANGDAGWAELYAIATEGGGDIRVFKSDDTTELPREIVSFSVVGETGEIHFKYSGTLSSTVDTDVHIYADGVSADYAVGATYGSDAVWSDYFAVWHFQGAVGSTQKKIDSTGNGYDWTENNSPRSGAGKIGGADGAYDMDGISEQTTSSSYDYLSQSGIIHLLATASHTMSAWFYPNASNSTMTHLLYQNNNGGGEEPYAGLQFTSSLYANFIYSSGTSSYNSGYTTNQVTVGSWNYMVGKKLTSPYYSEVKLNNGTKKTGTSGALAAGTNSGSSLWLGRRYNSSYENAKRYFDGATGEVRIRNSATSDNWDTTEYNNQNSPGTFYAVTAVTVTEIDQALTATAQATALIVKQVQRDIEAVATASTSFTRSVGKGLQAVAQATASIIRSVGKSLSVTAQASPTLQAGLLYVTELLATAQAVTSIAYTQVTIVALTVTAQASTAITQIYNRGVALVATAQATASVVKNSTLARTLTATASATASLVQSGLIISRTLVVTASATVTYAALKTLSKVMSVTAGAVVSLLKDFGYIDKYPENDATYEDKYPE